MNTVQRQQEADRARQAAADTIRQQNIAKARAQLEDLKTKLTKFAVTEKDKIRKDPKFRDEFHTMCNAIGVDPLQSRNGIWSKLGFGRFYHELSVKTIDCCIRLKRDFGTLIPIEDVIGAVTKSYGPDPPMIRCEDIAQALKNITKISGGYEIFQLGKRKFVKTVALEQEEDGDKLLQLASKDGWFKNDPKATGFNTARFEAAVRPLLNDGLVWIDRVPGGEEVRYWVVALFPGLK
jgi:ESCRT-II complex subunit VPS22